MIPSSTSAPVLFEEFRTRHFAGGGKRKGLKYPAMLHKTAVAYFRAIPGRKIETVANELGVGGVALKKWLDEAPRVRTLAAPPTPAFIPVDVIASKAAMPPELGNNSWVVTCREISVDLGRNADAATLRAVLAALHGSQGGAAL